MEIRCPTCKSILKPEHGKQVHQLKFFPFCSERCRLIDLGAWLDEDYRVSLTENENEEESNNQDE